MCGLIVRVSVFVFVPPALLALIVTEYIPAAVGVPEIRPLLISIVRPGGSPVASKLVGLLVALI